VRDITRVSFSTGSVGLVVAISVRAAPFAVSVLNPKGAAVKLLKLHRVLVPLAFVITPGVVLAQKGHDKQPDRDAQRAAAVAAQHVVIQQPQHVRRDVDRDREEAGKVDRRFTQPEVVRRPLTHGDVTRSLRADERANDVSAHRKVRHHKRHKKG